MGADSAGNSYVADTGNDRVQKRSSKDLLFRETVESFIRSEEGLSDFIGLSFRFEDRVRRETALDGLSGELTGLGFNVREDKAVDKCCQ